MIYSGATLLKVNSKEDMERVRSEVIRVNSTETTNALPIITTDKYLIFERTDRSNPSDPSDIKKSYIVISRLDVGEPRYISKQRTESVWDTLKRQEGVLKDKTAEERFSGLLKKLETGNYADKAIPLVEDAGGILEAKDFQPGEEELAHIVRQLGRASGNYRADGPLEDFARRILTVDPDKRITAEQAETMLAIREMFGVEDRNLSEVPKVVKAARSLSERLYMRIADKLKDVDTGLTLDSNLSAVQAYKLSFDIANDQEISNMVKEIYQIIKVADNIHKTALNKYGSYVKDTPYAIIAGSISDTMRELLTMVDSRHIAQVLLRDEVTGKRMLDVMDNIRGALPENIAGKYTVHPFTPFDPRAHAPKESFDDPDSDISIMSLERLFRATEKNVMQLVETHTGLGDSQIRGSMSRLVEILTHSMPTMLDHAMSFDDHMTQYKDADVYTDNTDLSMAVKSFAGFGKLAASIVPGYKPGSAIDRGRPYIQTQSIHKVNAEGEEYNLFDDTTIGGYAGELLDDTRSSVPRAKNIYDSMSFLKEKMSAKDVYSISQHAARIMARSPSPQRDRSGQFTDSNAFLSSKLAKFVSKDEQLSGARRFIEKHRGTSDNDKAAIVRTLTDVLRANDVDPDKPLSADLAAQIADIEKQLATVTKSDQLGTALEKAGVQPTKKLSREERKTLSETLDAKKRELADLNEETAWNQLVENIVASQVALRNGLDTALDYEGVVETMSSTEMRAGGNPEINYYRSLIASIDAQERVKSDADMAAIKAQGTPYAADINDPGDLAETHRATRSWAKRKLRELTGTDEVPPYFYNSASLDTPAPADHYRDSLTSLREQASTWTGRHIDESYWAVRELEHLTGSNRPKTIEDITIRENESILVNSNSPERHTEARMVLKELTGMDYPEDYKEQYLRTFADATPKDTTDTYQFFDPSIVSSPGLNAIRTVTGEYLGKSANTAEYTTKMHLVAMMENMDHALYPFRGRRQNTDRAMHAVENAFGRDSAWDIRKRIETLTKVMPAISPDDIKDPIFRAILDENNVITNQEFKDGQWHITYSLTGDITDEGRRFTVIGKPEHMVYNMPELTPPEVIANNETFLRKQPTPYGYIPVKHVAEGLIQQPTVEAHLHDVAARNIRGMVDEWRSRARERNPAFKGDNVDAPFTIKVGRSRMEPTLTPAESALFDFAIGEVSTPPEIGFRDILDNTPNYQEYRTYRRGVADAYGRFAEQHPEFANELAGSGIDITKVPQEITPDMAAGFEDFKSTSKALKDDFRSFNKELNKLKSVVKKANKALKRSNKVRSKKGNTEPLKHTPLMQELVDMVATFETSIGKKISTKDFAQMNQRAADYSRARDEFDKTITRLSDEYGERLDKFIKPNSDLYSGLPPEIQPAELSQTIFNILGEHKTFKKDLSSLKQRINNFDLLGKSKVSTDDTMFIALPDMPPSDSLAKAYREAFDTQLEAYVAEMNGFDNTENANKPVVTLFRDDVVDVDISSMTPEDRLKHTAKQPVRLDPQQVEKAAYHKQLVDRVMQDRMAAEVFDKGLQSALNDPNAGMQRYDKQLSILFSDDRPHREKMRLLSTVDTPRPTPASQTDIRITDYKAMAHDTAQQEDLPVAVVNDEIHLKVDDSGQAVTSAAPYITPEGYTLNDPEGGSLLEVGFNMTSSKRNVSKTPEIGGYMESMGYATFAEDGTTMVNYERILNDMGVNKLVDTVSTDFASAKSAGISEDGVSVEINNYDDHLSVAVYFDYDGANSHKYVIKQMKANPRTKEPLKDHVVYLDHLELPKELRGGTGIEMVGELIKSTHQQAMDLKEPGASSIITLSADIRIGPYVWSASGWRLSGTRAKRDTYSTVLKASLSELRTKYAREGLDDTTIQEASDSIELDMKDFATTGNFEFFRRAFDTNMTLLDSNAASADYRPEGAIGTDTSPDSIADKMYKDVLKSQMFDGIFELPNDVELADLTDDDPQLRAFIERYESKVGRDFMDWIQTEEPNQG
jgi:hypothetical protein